MSDTDTKLDIDASSATTHRLESLCDLVKGSNSVIDTKVFPRADGWELHIMFDNDEIPQHVANTYGLDLISAYISQPATSESGGLMDLFATLLGDDVVVGKYHVDEDELKNLVSRATAKGN